MAKTPTTPEPQESLLGENTVISVTVPLADHKSTYEKVVASYAGKVTVPGFRKGKAPKDLVEQSLNREKLIEEVLQQLLPPLYAEKITELSLSPLVTPQMNPKNTPVDGDWEVELYTAVAPEVKLGNWKEVVKKAQEEHLKSHTHEKKADEQGEEQKPPTKEEEEQHALSAVFGELIKSIKPKIAPVLLENEVRRQITEFFQHLDSHKISPEVYMKRAGKTIQDIEQDYTFQALTSLQLEFILQELSKEIDPQPTAEEIEKLLGEKAKTLSTEAKTRLETEAKNVLIRQKTVEELKKIAKI